ncbi:hypothetical protein KKA47_03620, partial [bacterium]|nr:hypothetical protein [bacterium]
FFTGTVDGLGENIAGMIIGLKHLYLSSDKIVSRSPYKYGPMRVFGTFILMGGKMLANLPEGIYHSFKSIGQRSINAFSGELNMSQAGKNVGGFLFEIGNMLLLGKGVAQIVKSGSTTVAFTSGTSGGSALVLAGVEIPALGVVGAGVAKVGLAGAGIFKTEAGQPIGPAHINPSEIIENLYKKAQDSWREYMADLNTKGWRSKAPEWTRRFIRVKPTPKKMQAWLEEFKKAETPGDLMRQTDCIDITQRGSQRLLNILIEGPLEITRSPELLASMKKIVKNNPDLYLMLKNNKAACLAGYARAIEKGWADLAKALNDRIGLYSDLGL